VAGCARAGCTADRWAQPCWLTAQPFCAVSRPPRAAEHCLALTRASQAEQVNICLPIIASDAHSNNPHCNAESHASRRCLATTAQRATCEMSIRIIAWQCELCQCASSMPLNSQDLAVTLVCLFGSSQGFIFIWHTMEEDGGHQRFRLWLWLWLRLWLRLRLWLWW
jgi:hypothetical protein